MGYTHYWTPRPISAAAWQVVERDFTSLFFAARIKGIALGGWHGDDETDTPVIAEEQIAFNGVGADAHETFLIGRGETEWSFCKTAFKPYDVFVVAALVYLANQHGYVVTSDGDEADWEAGFALARLVWPHIEFAMPAIAE